MSGRRAADAIQPRKRSGASAHVLESPEPPLDRAGGRASCGRCGAKDVDPLRGVLHVRQTVKRDVASRDADRATVDTYGREVGRPRNCKARTISLPCWLRDMLAEHLPRPAPDAGPEHAVFDTASGKPVYHTVFMRRVFGPAEAALPAEKQGLRLYDLRHSRIGHSIVRSRQRLWRERGDDGSVMGATVSLAVLPGRL